MAFDPNKFLASSPSQGGFDPDKFLAEDDYWGDVRQSAKEGLEELPEMARGMAEMVPKINPLNLPLRGVQTAYDIYKGKPIAETPMAETVKAYADLGKGVVGGVVEGVKDTASVVKAPFEWLGGEDLAETDIGKKFRERPFGVPLGVAGTVAMGLSAFKAGASGVKALKGMRGAKAVAGAGAAEDVVAGIPKKPLGGDFEDFYHVTTSDVVPTIQKEGLLPGKMGAQGEVFDDVYLSKSLDASEARVEQLRQYAENPEDIKILRVRLPKDVAKNLAPDPEDMGSNVDFMSRDPIGPEFIDEFSESAVKPPPLFNPRKYAPAMKFKGQIYPGKPGQIHADITDALANDIDGIRWGEAGFIDTETGQYLSREELTQLANATKEMHSYGIKRMIDDPVVGKEYGISLEPEIPSGAEPPPLGAGAPPPGAGKPPPGGVPPPQPDPLQSVEDWLAAKYGGVAAKPGMIQKGGMYLQNLSQELGTKDIGLQPRQIQSMGTGFQGLERAEALVDYARDKGYMSPFLTDVSRKAKIKQFTKQAGQRVEASRAIGDTRAVPPIAEIRQQIQAQLTDKWGIDAPNEIKKVLKKFDKAATDNPTFSGMADLATDLNKAKTPATKLGQHPAPTTDAANIVSRLNNDALRKVLNPQDAEAYTTALQDFGAHKQLEQAVSAAARRSASARSNQRGLLGRLFQEALDRGGYRIGGGITRGLGKLMVKSPERFKTLRGFFEELANETGNIFEDFPEEGGMAFGGIVGEMDQYLTPKYGGKL